MPLSVLQLNPFEEEENFNGTLSGNMLEGKYSADSSVAGITVGFGNDGEIKKNEIINCLGDDIIVSGGSGYLFKQNEIENSALNGIILNGTASLHDLVEENEIELSGDNGIWVQARASDNILKKNDISNSGGAGILDEGTGTTGILDDNTIV